MHGEKMTYCRGRKRIIMLDYIRRGNNCLKGDVESRKFRGATD